MLQLAELSWFDWLTDCKKKNLLKAMLLSILSITEFTNTSL